MNQKCLGSAYFSVETRRILFAFLFMTYVIQWSKKERGGNPGAILYHTDAASVIHSLRQIFIGFASERNRETGIQSHFIPHPAIKEQWLDR